MNRLFIALYFAVVALLSHSSQAADPTTAPFESVLVRHHAIIATLPAKGTHWLINAGSLAKRVSEYGETFKLHAGDSLRLVEKHSSYSFTAQLTPTPGLQVTSTVDARSFGGTVTKKNSFIPAR